MNTFFKIAAFSMAMLLGVSARAAELDNASQEVYGAVAPPQIQKPAQAESRKNAGRAAAKADPVRGPAAGGMDFASQEAYGFPLNSGTALSTPLRMAGHAGK